MKNACECPKCRESSRADAQEDARQKKVERNRKIWRRYMRTTNEKQYSHKR